MISYQPKDLPIAQLHGYLLGAIAPRPIALVSTINEKGERNLSPFSFFNVFSANPPIAIFSPARRGRDNTTKHTYENCKVISEAVINVVNYNIVEQTSLSSTEYPEGIDEFIKAGLTPLASDLVKPFRVKESPVQLECKVKDIIELGSNGGAGNLIISEIVKLHIQEEVLDDMGAIDPFKIDLVGRLGKNWYSRTTENSLFEVEKPLARLGIGFDNIPADIKNSKVLTGNDLGKLGNIQFLPDETDVNEYKLIELSDLFQELDDDKKALENKLHIKAQKLLQEGRVEEAWKTLLAFNN